MATNIADDSTITGIVYSSDALKITWNGSATFNAYAPEGDGYRETACFTVYDVETTEQAAELARQWAEEAL